MHRIREVVIVIKDIFGLIESQGTAFIDQLIQQILRDRRLAVRRIVLAKETSNKVTRLASMTVENSNCNFFNVNDSPGGLTEDAEHALWISFRSQFLT